MNLFEFLIINIKNIKKTKILNTYNYKSMDLQKMIENNITWNEEIGEWQLKCIAYTGNNMNKDSSANNDEETPYKNFVSCYMTNFFDRLTIEVSLYFLKKLCLG